MSQVVHQASIYLWFLYHVATRGIFTSLCMGCYSIAGSPLALYLPVPIYTPGWREALWVRVKPKYTTQFPLSGLDPGLLSPEGSTVTMRPLLLHHLRCIILFSWKQANVIHWWFGGRVIWWFIDVKHLTLPNVSVVLSIFLKNHKCSCLVQIKVILDLNFM